MLSKGSQAVAVEARKLGFASTRERPDAKCACSRDALLGRLGTMASGRADDGLKMSRGSQKAASSWFCDTAD